jgi:hypothetical protein
MDQQKFDRTAADLIRRTRRPLSPQRRNEYRAYQRRQRLLANQLARAQKKLDAIWFPRAGRVRELLEAFVAELRRQEADAREFGRPTRPKQPRPGQPSKEELRHLENRLCQAAFDCGAPNAQACGRVVAHVLQQHGYPASANAIAGRWRKKNSPRSPK